MRRQLSHQRQAGNGLISVIVATGILGILGALTATYFKNSTRATASIADRGDLESIRRTVLNRIACANTVASLGGAAKCTGALVNVLDKQGNVFIASTGTKFGKWTVRATCNANDPQLVVEVGQLKSGAAVTTNVATDFNTDALNANLPLSFLAMQTHFFPAGISPCESGTKSTAVWATAVSGQVIPPLLALTTVALTRVHYDRSSEFAGSTFTATQGGIYQLNYSVQHRGQAPSWSTGGCCSGIQVGGGPVFALSCNYPSSNLTSTCTNAGSTSILLNSGDRVSVITSHDKGLTVTQVPSPLAAASFSVTGPY